MKRFFLFFFFLLRSFSVSATQLPMDIAVLRGLDKVTGRISTFSIPVGEIGTFGRTFVVPEACYTRPPEESPENTVFLYVFEKSLRGENVELFKGWMFSSNPALSSMEHPVYDIWVIGCEKNTQINKPEENEQQKMLPTSDIDTEKIENTEMLIENEVGSVRLLPSAVEMEEL